MIAVIGVVCVTALSYSFTDTGKVKISFRPIEEFGFKAKRIKTRKFGHTVNPPSQLIASVSRTSMTSESTSQIGRHDIASYMEQLCSNNTMVGIDADRTLSLVRGVLVGSVLNGSLLEIVNGTVLVNGVKLNCSWFLVNVTHDTNDSTALPTLLITTTLGVASEANFRTVSTHNHHGVHKVVKNNISLTILPTKPKRNVYVAKSRVQNKTPVYTPKRLVSQRMLLGASTPKK